MLELNLAFVFRTIVLNHFLLITLSLALQLKFKTMSLKLYNPFENLYFNDQTCFLTGDDLNNEDDKITVFPEWIMDRFDYRERKFVLMDTVNSILYKDLKIPCSPKVREAYNQLDREVEQAFDGGYEAMKSFDDHKLFLWISRMVYGVLYQEIDFEIKRLERREEKFKISPVLKERFSMFHLMMQSLISPIEFSEKKPWSIEIVNLNYSNEVFNHRDDAINLIFSLGIKGFGIIACLQDNGVLMNEQKDILAKIGDTVLHPIQFEELCAKILYLDYLLQVTPKYRLEDRSESLYIEALEVEAETDRSIFSVWDNDMFQQVLQDYWTPWALTEKDIMGESNYPISFLEDAYTFEFISPESIKLDY